LAHGLVAGAAKAIAKLLVSAGHGMGGGAAIHISVYVATVLLANVVANNAAAALMYPIAINVATTEGMRIDLMAYLLMLAASASFAVPFGYQTNLMVYGAGGYKFKDFLKFGGPMQVRPGASGAVSGLFLCVRARALAVHCCCATMRVLCCRLPVTASSRTSAVGCCRRQFTTHGGECMSLVAR
jgi:Sodium:sulfate symporter transmembrane region